MIPFSFCKISALKEWGQGKVTWKKYLGLALRATEEQQSGSRDSHIPAQAPSRHRRRMPPRHICPKYQTKPGALLLTKLRGCFRVSPVFWFSVPGSNARCSLELTKSCQHKTLEDCPEECQSVVPRYAPCARHYRVTSCLYSPTRSEHNPILQTCKLRLAEFPEPGNGRATAWWGAAGFHAPPAQHGPDSLTFSQGFVCGPEQSTVPPCCSRLPAQSSPGGSSRPPRFLSKALCKEQED